MLLLTGVMKSWGLCRQWCGLIIDQWDGNTSIMPYGDNPTRQYTP
jgi:hypothetical protein